jgi:hypothetical protein
MDTSISRYRAHHRPALDAGHVDRSGWPARRGDRKLDPAAYLPRLSSPVRLQPDVPHQLALLLQRPRGNYFLQAHRLGSKRPRFFTTRTLEGRQNVAQHGTAGNTPDSGHSPSRATPRRRDLQLSRSFRPYRAGPLFGQISHGLRRALQSSAPPAPPVLRNTVQNSVFR